MARAARRQGESQYHKRRSSQARSAPLAQMNLNAAGIEVGATEHWVAVPEDREEEPVRRFGACTADLYALADWLRQCQIETVVLESTGVSWMTLFEVLEERGFDVKLVDAHDARQVPGRKTDVKDCQWLQELVWSKNSCSVVRVVFQEPPSRSRHWIGPARFVSGLAVGKSRTLPLP